MCFLLLHGRNMLEKRCLLGDRNAENSYSTFEQSNEGIYPSSPFAGLTETVSSWFPSWDTLYRYVPSPSQLFNVFFSTATAAPYIPYTIQFYSQIPPSELNSENLAQLSIPQLSMTVGMSSLTFLMGVVVHYRFFRDSGIHLLEILTDWTDKVLSNSLTSFLTLATMIAAYGLGYDAFVQSGELYAVTGGVLYAALFGAFRLTFVPWFINRISDYFDTDIQFKNRCIDYINQIHSEEAFRDCLSADTLNENNMYNLLMRMDSAYQRGDPAGFFEPGSLKKDILKHSVTSFNILMGLTFFSVYGLYNIQTGYRGWEVICRLASKDCAIDSYSHGAKLLIGLPSGVSSGMVAAIMGFDMVQLFQSTYQYLGKHRSHLLVNLIILSGIIGGSLADIGPVTSPAFNIANNPDNLIFISTDNLSGPVFILVSALFSFLLDFSGLKDLALNKEYPRADLLKKEDAIGWVKDKQSTELMQQLKSYGLFSKNRKNSSALLELGLPDSTSEGRNSAAILLP